MSHFSGIIEGRRCFNLPAGVYRVYANDNSVKGAIREAAHQVELDEPLIFTLGY